MIAQAAGIMVGLLGAGYFLVTAVGWFRAVVHRIPPASGDGPLAAELARLSGSRTRRVAAAVIDPVTGSLMAFLGAEKDTRFEVGSVTKAFTGMLLAEAVRRGEVRLDTTVASLLPETATSDLGTVTLQELCTHTSGLPRLPSTPAMTARSIGSVWVGTDPYRSISAASVLNIASRLKLTNRGQYRYSNLGAAVLGQLLARVSGRDYATLLTERVFTPTGMLSTHLPDPAGAAPRGWTAAGRRSQPWVADGYAPAVGVVSTLADMTRLANALLDGSAPGLASIQPIHHTIPDRPGRVSGMFWAINPVTGTGGTMVWHNGLTGGYCAFLALYPQTHRAVIVLADVAKAGEQRRVAIALTHWLTHTHQH